MPGINDLILQQPNPNELGNMSQTSGMPLQAPLDSSVVPPETVPQQMVSPEQVSELKKLFSTVQTANSKLVSGSLTNRNQLSLMRKDLIMKLFDIMKQAGIDPSNPLAIKSFLEQLSEQDPDLLQIFETAFQTLNNETTPQGLPAQEQSTTDQSGQATPLPANLTTEPNLMDRFQNLNRMG